jgi:hypothetical protein
MTFRTGDRVTNARFGAGTVTKIDAFHTTVDFDSRGERTFLSSKAALTPLSDESEPSGESPVHPPPQ